jgi:hypothetical protein
MSGIWLSLRKCLDTTSYHNIRCLITCYDKRESGDIIHVMTNVKVVLGTRY